MVTSTKLWYNVLLMMTNKNELSRPDESNPAPLRDAVDFSEAFRIEIPRVEGAGGVNAELYNQKQMFALREMFLANPQGKTFAWIPHAIEAYIRSRRSDLLPDFGAIRGIEVDLGKEGKVRIITEGEVVAPFEISIEELTNYSIEWMLDRLDEEGTVKPVAYSPEMQKSVAALSQDAQHRWDLITRASRHIAEGRDQYGDKKIRCGGVGSDMLSPPNGVGVFVDVGGGRANFSSVKVTGRDVPFTDYEYRMLQLVSSCNDFRHMGDAAGRLDLSLYVVSDALGKKFGFKYYPSAFGKFFENIRYQCTKAVAPDSDYVRAREVYRGIATVQKFASYHHLQDTAHPERLMHVGQMHVFEGKYGYREQHPFELTPDDNSPVLRTAGETWEKQKGMLAGALTLVAQNAETISRSIPQLREGEQARVNALLGNLAQQTTIDVERLMGNQNL